MKQQIDSKTQIYGILGNPVSHSLSPLLHNAAFQKFQLNSVYLAFTVKPDSLALAFEGIRALGIKGVNVTIPFKEEALNYVDEVPEDIDRITGAINTVINKDGRLFGCNTDGAGFLEALDSELSFKPSGKDVLVLGAGGAARGVVFALAKENADHIFIYNRTRERARGLAEYASTHFPETEIVSLDSPEDLPDKKMDLVVNTTSCGMKDNKEIPLDWGLIRQPNAAYDLVYTLPETPWLKEARRIGIPSANGLGMLIGQAAISFSLWTGKKEGIREVMKGALNL